MLRCRSEAKLAQVGFLCVALSWGCVDRDPTPPSVLLIVVDTLRADRLGSHGNPRGLTPALDELAAAGARFDAAQAHAPWTLPSVATLLTSRLPLEHGAGGSLDLNNGATVPQFRRLDPAVETIADRFRTAGYRTASFVNVVFLGSSFGLTRGFEHVDEQGYESNEELRRAGPTTDAALAWLSANGQQPFFALVHYFDAHAIYDPPAEFRRRFAALEDQESRDFDFGTRHDMVRVRSNEAELDPALIERAERLYDAEVAYVDSEIARLLDGLSALRLAGNTIVLVTSDHGEEFLEHGDYEHGHTHYQELLHVPLIVWAPSRVPARVIHQRIGLVDVGPTLCELAGIEPPRGSTGTSLVPLLQGAETARRPILAHGNFWGSPIDSAILGDDKLILAESPKHRAQLYDLASDAQEQHDRFDGHPERAAKLEQLIESSRRAQEVGARGADVDLDAAELDRLHALGYVGAAADDEPR